MLVCVFAISMSTQKEVLGDTLPKKLHEELNN